MKPCSFQINFRDFNDPLIEKNASVEFLPCQFNNNIDECNKDVYFDPIIKQTVIDG